MQGLEERSDGRWRPSPGSVYPALQQLEDEGLIHSVADRRRRAGRAFELTDKGANSSPSAASRSRRGSRSRTRRATLGPTIRQKVGGLIRAVMHVAQDGTPSRSRRH